MDGGGGVEEGSSVVAPAAALRPSAEWNPPIRMKPRMDGAPGTRPLGGVGFMARLKPCPFEGRAIRFLAERSSFISEKPCVDRHSSTHSKWDFINAVIATFIASRLRVPAIDKALSFVLAQRPSLRLLSKNSYPACVIFRGCQSTPLIEEPFAAVIKPASCSNPT